MALRRRNPGRRRVSRRREMENISHHDLRSTK
jgi:hypothetical protein